MAYKGKKLAAVIPARLGSKGIPGKNIKRLNGKPLIFYITDTIMKSGIFDKIVVTTDNNEIIDLFHDRNVFTIKRPDELALDHVPLDPVILHAYNTIAKEEEFDYIFTFQPTSPLLSLDTINNGVKLLIDNDYDSILSVVDDRHLRWTTRDNINMPLYKERVNRQLMEPAFRETGAIIACRNDVIKSGTRIGKNIGLLLVPADESIDIDDYNDWILVEEIMKKLVMKNWD